MSSDQPKPLSPSVAAAELSPGQSLGKYKIARKLGAGGMGTVFLADDVDLKRTVALKVLPRDRAENPTLVRRFKAEGQAAAQLHHKNIVQVYEAGQIDGYLYLALEYVDGIDLLEWIRKRGPLPVKRSIEMIKQVCEALQHAYEKSIVHRDIKPSNLMITSAGLVKLADMGLARSIDETLDTSITRDGTTVGTIDYMAPEQARNSKAADIRSDIYSLGCTWYHMLTGNAPFPDGSITNKVQAHANAPRPNPRDRNPAVPSGIVAVMHRMMAPKQEERYRTPADLIADLTNENVVRADVMPDLLAALSSDAEAGTPKQPVVRGDDDDDDWEQIFHRVRESDSSEPQSFEFDLQLRESQKIQDDTREVAEDRDLPKRQKVKKKGTTKPASEEAAEETRKQVRPAEVERDRRGKPMPAKMKNPESLAAPKSIDVDYLKVGLLLIGIFALSTVLWWGWTTYFSDSGENFGPITNPYGDATTATGQPPATSDSAMQNPSQEPEGAEPSDGPQTPDANADNMQASGNSESPSENPVSVTVKNTADQLPDWVRTGWAPPAGQQDPELRIIERGTKTPGPNSALSGLPKQGGVIKFAGIGPYYLQPAILDGIEQVQILGSPDARPILMIRDDDLGDDRVLLTLNRCRLSLEHLHLVYVGPHAGQSTAAQLIKMNSGELSVKNCSVSAVGPLQAVDFCRTGPGQKSRILVESSIFRGGALTVIRTEGSQAECVIRKSLLVSDDSIPLEFTSGCSLYLQKSTCLSRNSILRLRHTSKAGSARFQLMLHDDRLIHCPGGETNVAAIMLSPWPVEKSPNNEHPQADFLDFSSRELKFHGWNALSRLSDAASINITADNAASWRQFWRQPLMESALHDNADLVSLGQQGTHLASVETLRTSLNQYAPTPEISDLWLTGLWQERVTAIAQRRPAAAPSLLQNETPLQFDLAKESPQNSLQNLINSDRCPDGSQIICSGSGIKLLQPVTIAQKRIRIDFQTTGAVPLDVRPAAETEGDALFTVSGGRLELVNANLSVSPSRSKRYASCLVRMESGEVVLQNCQLSGPPETPEGTALIEWKGSPEVRTAGTLMNSVIRGDATLLGGSLASGELILNNCLLLSGGTAIHLYGNQVGGELSLVESTISAAGSILKIEDSPEPGDWTIFARETVFAPPLKPTLATENARTAAVIEISDLSIPDLHWWETGCAYASQLNLRNGPAEPIQLKAVQDFWGSGHVVDVLAGSNNVVLEGVLESQSRARIEDFSLSKGSLAANWNSSGGPIGFQGVAVPTPSGTSVKSPAEQAAPPKTNRKNPGF